MNRLGLIKAARATRAAALTLLAMLAASLGQAAPSGAAASLIHIRFAGDAYPEIRERGRAPARAYGVYAPPGERRLRARLEASLPAPDPRLYELDWIQDVAPAAAGIGAPCAEPWGYPFFRDPLARPWLISPCRMALGPVAEVRPYPRYDRAAYQADLAAWREARLRAASAPR